MSGGGGGGSSSDQWRVAGSSEGDGDDQCAITERTVLNSPVPDVVADLQVGNILSIELETQPRDRVVAKTSSGLVAGGITSTRIADIIECLRKSIQYKAQVLSVTGGRVEIEVRRA